MDKVFLKPPLSVHALISKLASRGLLISNRNLAIQSFAEQAVIIDRLLNSITEKQIWKKQLYLLFEKYDKIPMDQMGFMKNWKNDDFWAI